MRWFDRTKRRSVHFLPVAVFLMVVLFAAPALAVPVQWTSASGGNDHWYELVTETLNWSDAASAAAAAYDADGYLATVTSQDEQNFLNALNATDLNAWLGGTDQYTEGVWVWDAGLEAGDQFWQGAASGYATAPYYFAYWSPGAEPNDYYSSEDALVGWWTGDYWNDLPITNTSAAYVVEWDSNPVPEPGTLFLLGLGLAGVTARRRRTGK